MKAPALPTVVFAASLLLAAPLAARARDNRAIAQFAEGWLQEQFASPGSRVETHARALSPSLDLSSCAGAMRASLPPNVRPMSRMSILVRCTRGGDWSVRVAVSMKIFAKVLVTTRPLMRGDGVGAADVHTEERDITRLGYGYILASQPLTRRTLAHALPKGAVLTRNALGGRQMVRAGDHVQVVAELSGIQVRAQAVALGGGDSGARLRVRNEASGRVVDAQVSEPGVVLALP